MMRAVVGLVGMALALAGCLDASAQRCSSGVCAPGTVCVASLDACAKPSQLAACSGMADGERCVADGVAGVCTSGVCLSGSICGDGVIEGAEACDDGNRVAGDGCNAECTSNETCGNNVVDPGEDCDCGTSADVSPSCPGPNSDTSGVCSRGCKLRCGDGVLEPDEVCDPRAYSVVSCIDAGFDRGVASCSASCTAFATADCAYIGWRTTVTQTAAQTITDVAPFNTGQGFYITGSSVGHYQGASGTIDYADPAGQPFAAIWAPDHEVAAAAVGAAGTIAMFRFQTWVPGNVQPPVSVDLRAVWGRSQDDIYAVGDATILRWDNTGTWSQVPLAAPLLGSYRAVGGDAGHVYVVGDGGLVLVYDGATWQKINVGTTENLHGVWSVQQGGVSLVVAVGDHGTIVQYDGMQWVPGRTTSVANLTSVWGSSSDGFFAVGDRGTLLFYDGAVWRSMIAGRGLVGSVDQPLHAVHGVTGSDVIAVGSEDVLAYQGAAWTVTAAATSETLYGLWGSAPDDVYAVGGYGSILHHDGFAWTSAASPTGVDLRAVSGTAFDDIYAAGDDLTLLHYGGASWTTVHAGALGSGELSGVFARAPGDVYATGTAGTYHYNGAFTQMSAAAGDACWAAGSEVWVGGPAGVGAAPGFGVIAPTAGPIASISGTSATDVYAVGAHSFHFDGTAWKAGPFADDPDLAAVVATPAAGFAVGRGGKLSHLRAGTGAQIVDPFATRRADDLHAAFAIGHLVFFAGANGAIEILVFHR
jgi:cysteine-rich repeat protein